MTPVIMYTNANILRYHIFHFKIYGLCGSSLYIHVQMQLVQVIQWMWENNIKASCQTDRPTSKNKKTTSILNATSLNFRPCFILSGLNYSTNYIINVSASNCASTRSIASTSMKLMFSMLMS